MTTENEGEGKKGWKRRGLGRGIRAVIDGDSPSERRAPITLPAATREEIASIAAKFDVLPGEVVEALLDNYRRPDVAGSLLAAWVRMEATRLEAEAKRLRESVES